MSKFTPFEVKCIGLPGYVTMHNKMFTVIDSTEDHYVLAGKPGFWGKHLFELPEKVTKPSQTGTFKGICVDAGSANSHCANYAGRLTKGKVYDLKEAIMSGSATKFVEVLNPDNDKEFSLKCWARRFEILPTPVKITYKYTYVPTPKVYVIAVKF
jgi:hypothetical protein